MIEIKSVAADAIAEYEECGIIPDAAWEMTERETRLGFSCVKREEDVAYLTRLCAPDTPLTDALLRATLNALRAQGVKNAVIEDAQLKKHVLSKGYVTSFEEVHLKIDEFFSKSVCKG